MHSLIVGVIQRRWSGHTVVSLSGMSLSNTFRVVDVKGKVCASIGGRVNEALAG